MPYVVCPSLFDVQWRSKVVRTTGQEALIYDLNTPVSAMIEVTQNSAW